MSKKHIILALLVTFAWGINFPITKLGLRGVDPFLLTGIRFALAAIPMVFIVKRPTVRFGYVIAYGLIFGVGMWGLINYGISVGVAPGIASLIIQFSAFFTIGWGSILFGEKIRPAQIIGAIFALFGLLGVMSAQKGLHQILGISLIIFSAVAWSLGNVVIKKSKVKEIFSFTVWASIFPPIPLLLWAWTSSDGVAFQQSWNNLSWAGLLSIIFQVYIATHFAYWGWNTLVKIYPVSVVAPLSLLIPVFGIITSVFILGERVSAIELISVILIIFGLAIGIYKRPVPAPDIPDTYKKADKCRENCS